MRVLFLATNAETEASTRYRVLQYFPSLRAAGHEPELVTFFPAQASSLPRPFGKAARVASGLARRALAWARLGRYDLVVIHRELLPFGWNQAAGLFARRVPVVYDFDDAVWVPGLGGPTSRLATPGTTRRLVELASRVFAGNAYLAGYARESHDRVDVIPTVVDTASYRPAAATRAPREVPVVGWIGSPTTARYLEPLLPLLDELARTVRFRLRVIGAGRPLALARVEVETPPWRLDGEAELFADLDVGLYPLSDDAWSRGKCGFKAIQYMASGVASVVSPVGVVREIARDGVDALWAESAADWKAALARLISDAAERTRLGAAGRARAQAAYSLASVAPRFIAGLEAVRR
jgi:glycosyltransferase involved in cell wall biosynthesis